MTKVRSVHATLPAKDFERAKSWYLDKLGIKPTVERPDGASYEVGDSGFLLYPSEYAGTNEATAASLVADDLDAAVESLRSNGVTFDEFDMPGVQWNNGIATIDAGDTKLRGAWCKDSEGNILAIVDQSLTEM